MLDPVRGFCLVTVSTTYDASATSIVLSSGHGAKLPDPSSEGNFNLVWYNSTDYNNPADDPNVEIIRVTGRSTDTLTVTRGQEGISATTKNTGGKVYKMLLATTRYWLDKVRTGINKRIPHTWTIPGEIKVASGNTDFICPIPIPVVSETLVRLVGVRYFINSGTSVTFKLQKNGSDITGFTGLSATTTATSTTPTAVSLADLDKIAVVVTAVSGTPYCLTVALLVEYDV